MNTNINNISVDDFLNLDKEQLALFFMETQNLRNKEFKDLESLKEKSILQSQIIEELKTNNQLLRDDNKLLKDKILIQDGYILKLTRSLYGPSSEKGKSKQKKEELANDGKINTDEKKERKKREKNPQKPSEKYPDADIYEELIELKDLPTCPCCEHTMSSMGQTEDSEFLTVIPKRYVIIRQKRRKYRCGKCHGHILTTPSPKRIIPGSVYSDEMIIDVSMSKYCDLIPIDRYAAMASRTGFKGLPPNSLIGTSHALAQFVIMAYKKIFLEILESQILHADETTQRMLEGDAKKTWYLWGFSTKESCYFEIHNTRSADVASDILTLSKCEYLVTDAYSGYDKAVRVCNEKRKLKELPKIQNVYCNAHARRKFDESQATFPEESEYFIKKYQEIYKLEKAAKATIETWAQENKYFDESEIQKFRDKMKPFFKEMKLIAEKLKNSYSDKSSIVTAINYFLNYYENLILFTGNVYLPIDNNHQEGLLRSPVVGKKTWYGFHSKQGAETAAIHFTLVESCKLNKVNPRKYYDSLITALHRGQEAFTPKEYKLMIYNKSNDDG